MEALLAQATVSSKGQVTLPVAIRAKLGIETGSRLHFELRGKQLLVRPELPMRAHYGMLKGYGLTAEDLEIAKEPDREFL